MIKFGFIFFMSYQLCFTAHACTRAEYEVDGECCPMCAPGSYVYWDCAIDTSTTCVPCPLSTYTDETNNLNKCISCNVCKAIQSLRVKRRCTRTADTVCEPLEGFYCVEQNKGSCIFALKHSECHPGQYIRQAGTAFTDTECADCTEGTYSNGSFITCQPHSKCETKGLVEIKPGTVSADAECRSSVGIIAGVTVVIVAVLVTAICLSLRYFKRKTNEMVLGNNSQVPIQESGSMTSQNSATPLTLLIVSPERSGESLSRVSVLPLSS